MKLFVLLQSQFKILGIHAVRKNDPNDKLNANNCMASLFVLHFLITSAIYLIVDARSIQEYADSFYGFTTALTSVIIIVVIISKRASIFRLIENMESAIEERNNQSIYIKLNEKIEQFSQRFYFAYVQCTIIGIMIPNFLKAFFIYFTTDLNGDAFQLPFLTSWAHWNVLMADNCYFNHEFLVLYWFNSSIFIDRRLIANHQWDTWPLSVFKPFPSVSPFNPVSVSCAFSLDFVGLSFRSMKIS